MIDPKTLWFNTPDSWSLCRGGGNGPNHPSQLYAIKKYVMPDMTILDYGCGSATTWEALERELDWPVNQYLGVDVIPKNIAWCKELAPQAHFAVNPSLHKIDQKDKSFDVVYSRHVVDHMESFEKALDEHKRVAKQLVIVILWVPLYEGDEHIIKNITDAPGQPTEKFYPDEYTNRYSREKILKHLHGDPKWKLVELTEGIKGDGVSANCDVAIVLERV